MIGYLIEQELGNLLPAEVPFATILTMVEVDADDPAFDDPTKFVGPIYDDAEAEALAAEKGWVFKRDGDRLRRVVAVAGAEADLRDPADPLAARPRRGRDLRRRRGDPDDVGAGQGAHARRRRGGHRQGLRQRAARPRGRGRPVRDGHRRRRRVRAVGDAGAAAARARHAGGAARLDFAAGSMGPKVEAAMRFVEATGKRAAIGALADIEKIVDGQAGTSVVDANVNGEEELMADFGVHSEVGKLRKVMVHRPDLSLQRLTPTNHDELLFDDVLWVERAQHEHDQFVARMRERGVEVFLLARAARRGAGGERRGATAADRARRVGVHGRLVAGRRDPQPARRPEARSAGQAPDRRTHRRRGRPRPRQGRARSR